MATLMQHATDDLAVRIAPRVSGAPSIRILFVSNTAEWTGPNCSLSLLIDHLPTSYEVRVLLPEVGHMTDLLAERGVPFSVLPSLNKWAIPAIWRTIKRERPDVVYANNTRSVMKNVLVAAKLARVPFVYHVRAMAHRGGWRKTSFLRFADAVICISKAVADSFSPFVSRDRMRVIYNGVDVPHPAWDRRQARARLCALIGAPTDVPLVLNVGNVCGRKGQLQAIEVLESTLRQVPSAVLLMFGALDRDAAYVARLQHVIRSRRMEEHAHIVGFHRDVVSLMSGADVLLHTAVEEPFGRVLIEAMAAGLPIVASRVDGVAEIVVDGETGFLCRVGDVGGMAERVSDLLQDAGLRRRIGEAGRLRCRDEFSAGATASGVAEVLRGIVRRRRGETA